MRGGVLYNGINMIFAMKRVYLWLCAAMVVLMVSCRKDGGEPVFESVEWRDSIGGERLSYVFDGEMELPVSGLESGVREALRDGIVSGVLGESYVGLSDRRLLRVYSDSSYMEYCSGFEQEMEVVDGMEFRINCENRVRGAVTFEGAGLLNYEGREYVYTGGAHGMSYVTNMIFDMESGRRLSEEDIFVDGAGVRIHELLVEGARVLRRDSVLPTDAELFGDDLLVPNGNVALDEGGLSYVYNPYEVAPYVYGVIVVRLDSEGVLPLLERSSPVYEFVRSLTEVVE